MTFEDHISALFSPLSRVHGTMPDPGAMKKRLKDMAPQKGSKQVSATQEIVKLYATSSVEMWLRAVHSFLISSALIKVSPLWASVSGYYSSHYVMRAFSHLLGYYHLHGQHYIVQLQPSGSGFACVYLEAKGLKRKEHSFYWVQVKAHPVFSNNELFTENPENVEHRESKQSDCAHRNYANYIDHLMGFPRFSPLNYEELKQRVDFLSKIEVIAYPIPDVTKYADIDSVQIVAYHRIVEYREILNRVLGDRNKFWSVHRNPDWTRGILTFQRPKPRLLVIGTE